MVCGAPSTTAIRSYTAIYTKKFAGLWSVRSIKSCNCRQCHSMRRQFNCVMGRSPHQISRNVKYIGVYTEIRCLMDNWNGNTEYGSHQVSRSFSMAANGRRNAVTCGAYDERTVVQVICSQLAVDFEADIVCTLWRIRIDAVTIQRHETLSSYIYCVYVRWMYGRYYIYDYGVRTECIYGV